MSQIVKALQTAGMRATSFQRLNQIIENYAF